MAYSVFTFAQKPESRHLIDRLSNEAWPPFLLHGNIHHWYLLFEMFADYQLLLCDSADTLIAVGHTVPFLVHCAEYAHGRRHGQGVGSLDWHGLS